MNYTGKLYGKAGRAYIPLVLTSEDVDRMEAELKQWRELPAKVDALISQTNIPLSAAVVRTTAINQVLDLIDEIQTPTPIADKCDPLRTKSEQDESDLHPAIMSLQDWYLQQHPEDQHGIDPLMDRMNSALYGLDRPLSRTTPPAERPAYCCGKCGRQAHELENGNWLSRINPGEVPSRWRCQAHIETGPPVSTAPAERPTPITDDTERKARIGHQSLTDGQWPWLAISEGWDHARNLERQRNEALEQRDRLADALRTWQRIAYAGANHEGLANARHKTDAALAAVKETTNARAMTPATESDHEK